MGFLDLQIHRWSAEKQLWMYQRVLKRPEYRGFCSFKFTKKLLVKYPGLWGILSVAVTLLSCIFVGFLFYTIFTIKYAAFPREVGTFMGLAVLMVVCTIQLLPVIRAVILVAIPSLMTSQIRAILMLMVVTWAFQIPAINITKNIQQATTATLCVQDRVKAHLKEAKAVAGAKIQTVPRTAFLKFIHGATKPFRKLREFIKSVDESVNKMLAWQRHIADLINQMLANCDEETRRPYYRCVEIVDKMHEDCLDGSFELICSPISLLRKMCSATRVLTLKCEWPQYLKKHLQETVGTVVKDGLRKSLEAVKDTSFYQLYEENKKNITDEWEDARNIELNVTHIYEQTNALALNFDVVKNKLRDEVSGLETFIRAVIWLLNALLLPMMLWPFVTASIYVLRFYRFPMYDNYFISERLDEIEVERRRTGRTTVLPLMPGERKTLIRITTPFMSRKERPYLFFALVTTTVGALVPTVIIMMDILLFKLMNKTFQFFSGNVSLGDVPGHYELKIAGKGFMKEMLESLLEVFQPLHQNVQDSFWKDCFEEPNPPDYLLFQLMFLLFVLAIALCFIQIYAKRCRHLIAELVFPEKRRLRGLKLYSSLLEMRMHSLNRVGGKKKNIMDVDELSASDVDDGRIQACIRCSKPDLEIRMGGASRVCTECNEFYCLKCYDQVSKCISCGKKLGKIENEINLYEDSSALESSEDEMQEVMVEGERGGIRVEDIKNVYNKAKQAKEGIHDIKDNINDINIVPSFGILGKEKDKNERETKGNDTRDRKESKGKEEPGDSEPEYDPGTPVKDEDQGLNAPSNVHEDGDDNQGPGKPVRNSKIPGDKNKKGDVKKKPGTRAGKVTKNKKKKAGTKTPTKKEGKSSKNKKTKSDAKKSKNAKNQKKRKDKVKKNKPKGRPTTPKPGKGKGKKKK
ncbi:unnamed protein product [Bursaphelenchus xylophilus]|uniref:(pine wood nematode) hypothetical protein n=1 Tax=Bursaphelenchus xylophilus TaxID=6326 RepID=A0A7I8X6X9_BURXY|nr:unnamed protein product [Bursaphelenchus xylophilus]CAG9123169.1 unnamed protein product [Bursaphelenchus xylophilus]